MDGRPECRMVAIYFILVLAREPDFDVVPESGRHSGWVLPLRDGPARPRSPGLVSEQQLVYDLAVPPRS